MASVLFERESRKPSKEDILFEPDSPKIDIDGLDYYPNYVTEEEEKELLRIIDNNPWNADIRRRQQHYGYVYYHTRHNLPTVQPSEQNNENPHLLPLSAFDFLQQRLIQDGIFPIDDPPMQCLVNEYIGNVRIAFHLDNIRAFGDTIAGISLGDPCYMTLKLDSDINVQTKFFMARRSLYVMKRDARFKWQHGITKKKHYTDPTTSQEMHRDENFRRVSLTFRKILIDGVKNGENPEHQEQLKWTREEEEEKKKNEN